MQTRWSAEERDGAGRSRDAGGVGRSAEDCDGAGKSAEECDGGGTRRRAEERDGVGRSWEDGGGGRSAEEIISYLFFPRLSLRPLLLHITSFESSVPPPRPLMPHFFLNVSFQLLSTTLSSSIASCQRLLFLLPWSSSPSAVYSSPLFPH